VGARIARDDEVDRQSIRAELAETAWQHASYAEIIVDAAVSQYNPMNAILAFVAEGQPAVDRRQECWVCR
jgi:hypothetical protein